MPYKVAFTYAGGHSKTIPELDDDKTNALLDAQSLQHAAHILHLGEKQRLVVNFRQVAALLITDLTPDPEPEPAPEEPTPEPAPVEPAPEHETEPEAPAPEEPAEDTRTVAELKAALDEKGVTYDSSDRKADLQELAKTNGV